MRITHTRRGQAILPEYVVMFFLVIGGLVAMTSFVQKSLQARSRDASQYMMNMASQGCSQMGPDCERAANFQNGALAPEYEPYYGMVDSRVGRDLSSSTGFDGPVFVKSFADQTAINSESIQHPPENAD